MCKLSRMWYIVYTYIYFCTHVNVKAALTYNQATLQEECLLFIEQNTEASVGGI